MTLLAGLLPRNDKTKERLPTLDMEYQSMSYVYFNRVNYSNNGPIFLLWNKGHYGRMHPFALQLSLRSALESNLMVQSRNSLLSAVHRREAVLNGT
jgi:hypothetical protein